MARYIDVDKVHELVENRQGRGDCKFCNKYERCVKNGINRKGSHLYCWEEIKLPRADVAEVKHGYWVRQEKMVDGKVQAEAVCSNCGTDVVYQVIDNRWQFENYCPHCGARMEGDE